MQRKAGCASSAKANENCYGRKERRRLSPSEKKFFYLFVIRCEELCSVDKTALTTT